ncbi:hypothetical protein Tco_0845038 [Tanacetum coccineum]
MRTRSVWIERMKCKYDSAASMVYLTGVIRIEVFPMYGYNYMKKIVLRRVDLKEYVIVERDFKYLYPSDFEDLQRVKDFQLGIESYQTQLNLTKPRWDAKGFEYKHDFTVIDSPRAVTFRDKYGVQMIMRFNEIHKFSDGTLHQIDEALDYRVKEFRVNRRNPGLDTRFWTKKDVDRSKEFMFAIQKRLKTRRIFQNLESFVGGRIRDGDLPMLILDPDDSCTTSLATHDPSKDFVSPLTKIQYIIMSLFTRVDDIENGGSPLQLRLPKPKMHLKTSVGVIRKYSRVKMEFFYSQRSKQALGSHKDGDADASFQCGGPFNGGNCPNCSIVGAENEFVYEPNPFPYNETPDFSYPPPQPQFEIYSCELCRNDSHYGFDCSPWFPLVYEQEPSYNQNFSDNYYPQNSPSFPQQYLCCENCGGPHESFQCQPMNQNYFEPNYSGFDQPLQYSIDHQPPIINQEWISKLNKEIVKNLRPVFEEFHKRQQAANIDQSPPHEISLKEIEDLKQHYLDEIKSLSNDLQIKDYRNEKIDIRFRMECEDMIAELKSKFNGMSIEINKKKELQYLEQVAKLSTYTTEPSLHFNCTCCDDDDYEESTIPLNEIDSQTPLSIEITPILPTLEPEDSLIMGNEELSTIPEKESDEFIKSSVEELVPIPSESEDTIESDSDCDLTSDDESLSDEYVPEDNVKIHSNPLFEFDDEYISSNINPLFDEVLADIECKDFYDSNLDESTFLVTPLFDSNEDECFTPSDDVELLLHHDSSTPMISKIMYDDPIDDLIFDPRGDIDEIDAFLDIDIPTNIKDDFYDSKADVLYLESLLSDDTTPSPPPEVFLERDPRSLRDINDLKIMVKVFDPGIHETIFSPIYVSLPFEDRHYLSFTYVIQIFLPYFTYPVNSSFPLSSGSEDIIFDPGISFFHFSSLNPVAYKVPMEVCSSTCFIPNITMIWGESS